MITKIWQKRWSVARGWRWEYVRDCHVRDIEAWLKVFRDDMPDAEFAASERKPRG